MTDTEKNKVNLSPQEGISPDGLAEEQFEESVKLHCSSCGGVMHFNPENGKLKCPYCDSEKDILVEAKEVVEHSLSKALDEGASSWTDEDIQCYNCSGCGAQIIFDAHTQAQFCNYCGSSHITLKKAEHTIAPHYLVPFAVDEKKALGLFKEWISGKWFAPNDLKTAYKNNKLLGTYVPHWTYDAETFSYYTAQRGDYYYETKTRTVDGKTETYQERHTRWTSVRGNYNRFFDDVLVRASKKVDQKLIDQVQPFEMSNLIAYTPQYLSGFYAERYSLTLEEGWEIAESKMARTLEHEIERRIGGDEVHALRVETTYDDMTFKHLLLPIWLSSYQYQDKIYHFMVNGQSGKTVGQYPKSAIKITILVMFCVLMAMLIYYTVSQNSTSIPAY